MSVHHQPLVQALQAGNGDISRILQDKKASTRAVLRDLDLSDTSSYGLNNNNLPPPPPRAVHKAMELQVK